MFRSLLFLTLFLITVPMVNADPISFNFDNVFASQNGGNTNVNLNTPNLLLAPTQIAPGIFRTLVVNFEVTVDPGQTWSGIARYDWVLNGEPSTTLNINCLTGCSSDVIHGLGSFLDYKTPFYTPTPVTLTLSVINDQNVVLGSRTFNFSIAEPVPEPATLLLVGSGVAMLSGVRGANSSRQRR